MAEYGAWTNGYCYFNSVDLSVYVTNLTLTLGKEMLDISAMGDTARVRMAGIEDHSLAITFNEDLTSGKVHATLRVAWAAGVAFPVNFKLVNDTISATNPEYQCTYILAQLPIGGQHGQKLVTTVTLQSCSEMVIKVTP